MKAWFFQANPKLYDIDSALRELNEIWWRVPQYTGEVHTDDIAILWRSGSEAGIVGIGRIASEPRRHQSDVRESDFILDPEISGNETRVLINVRPTAFIPKSRIAAMEGFEDHPIITAPRGTVMPVDRRLYERLSPQLSDPPEIGSTYKAFEFPRPFAWEQRSKSTHPMPGGYESYLDSLRVLAERIAEERPPRGEFPELIAQEFNVSDTRSNLLAAFLRKAGFITDRGEVVAASEPLERWLQSGDDRLPVALLHSRIRFIGEMLEAAVEPKSTSDMLEIANERYGCGWSTKAQIDRRRGWLQSAGMLTLDEANRLVTTEAGKVLLGELDLYQPSAAAMAVAPEPGEEPVQEKPEIAQEASSEIHQLTEELKRASVDSSKADRFEQAVRDCFEWLGFEAEWLGGAGKTDVLLDAPLGRDQSYRVIIDCKTSASGSVGDNQVDWITLSEHRKKHDANYVALVAPSPSGRRLFERAAEQAVTVISVEELATLCEQHASAPLDLEAYRSLFAVGGLVNTDAAAEKAEDWLHIVELAQLMVETIGARSEKFGPLTAKGLQLLLADDQAADSASPEDFQAILDSLSGPLFSVLTGDATTGYRLTTSPTVAEYRLSLLGQRLFGRLARTGRSPI